MFKSQRIGDLLFEMSEATPINSRQCYHPNVRRTKTIPVRTGARMEDSEHLREKAKKTRHEPCDLLKNKQTKTTGLFLDHALVPLPGVADRREFTSGCSLQLATVVYMPMWENTCLPCTVCPPCAACLSCSACPCDSTFYSCDSLNLQSINCLRL